MKGEVFNLFEAFICNNWGEDRFEEILENASSELETKEPFVGPETYPDHDMLTMVKHTCSSLEVEVSDAMKSFGEFCFKPLASKVPELVSSLETPFDLLSKLDSVVHPEVRKLYPGAITPHFKASKNEDGSITLEYRSPRKLYDFAEGLLAAVAKHFNKNLVCSREIITSGEDEGMCIFNLQFN